MLDLVRLAAQMSSMRDGLSALGDEMGPRLTLAAEAWGSAVALGPELRDRVTRARTSWLVAEPLEPLGPYAVRPQTAYRAVASDGSQVFPDRHESGSCFLLNTGVVDIDYAAGRAKLSSQPQLCWAPGDVFPVVGGERREADARIVGARRFAAECDALTARLTVSGEPLLALTDGTLLLWWLEPDPSRLEGLAPDDLKRTTLEALDRFLGTARAAGALPCGYLSAPRSTDVVSMLKVVLCTEDDPVDCDRCPYASGAKTWTSFRTGGILPAPQKPCEEADPVTDAALFARLLKPGERSPRFRSAARVTAAYEAPVDFVYLHAGAEVARVEFPAWLTPEGLDLLCGCLLDQCDKGMGYPVALSEAHEQAVVRASDRRAFLDLVARNGRAHTSAKLARKRRSVL